MVVLEEPSRNTPELFGIERSCLLELLATVGGTDWDRPTPCPAWTVRDLCTHLLGNDLSLLARCRDQYHGTPSPAGLAEPEFITWIDNLQREWVWAARRLSPRLLVELLAWTGPQLVDTLRRQDPDALSAHVSWASHDLVPVWLDHVRELSEAWIHRQQLLAALGHPADLRPDLVGPILEGLRWAYPFRLQHLGANAGDTVAIEISGPFSARWHLVAAATGWSFQGEPGSHLVASLSMTTDEAWRLLSNNLTAPDQARLHLTGDERIARVLLRTRAIIGSPK